MIKFVIKKYKLKNMVSYLCEIAGVSRSGYYNYFSEKSTEIRKSRNVEDENLYKIILEAYNFKNRKKGAKQIKMTLETHFQINFNLKRIRRIMKKFGIVCPYRKRNPYKKILKETDEHKRVANILNRNFKQGKPYKVLLTDITYLFYGNGNKAYLSTVLDGSTNEILSYELSKNLKIDFVIDTINNIEFENIKLDNDVLIHSDQGVHYTSPQFQKILKSQNISQSMSRRGICLDNSPQESFFGHMKDEINIDHINTFAELTLEIHDFMDYYNNYRCQWNLKKMTPVMYRNHLLSV